MANKRQGNVLRVDTTSSTFNESMQICGIKYIGAASGTATILGRGTSDELWQESGAANVFNEAKITAQDGITVNVTNGAIVYIYI